MSVDSIVENVQVDTTTNTDSFGVAGARERLLPNIISNIVYMGISIVANFLLTPFLIAHLGIAAYGMIPLVSTITSYMAVITTALDTSVARFLTIDLSRHDIRTGRDALPFCKPSRFASTQQDHGKLTLNRRPRASTSRGAGSYSSSTRSKLEFISA